MFPVHPRPGFEQLPTLQQPRYLYCASSKTYTHTGRDLSSPTVTAQHHPLCWHGGFISPLKQLSLSKTTKLEPFTEPLPPPPPTHFQGVPPGVYLLFITLVDHLQPRPQ